MRGFFTAYEFAMLFYFAALNLFYGLFGYVGLRNGVVLYSKALSGVALKDLSERDVFKPVSILVPAYNEEKTIVASVRSFLELRYPQHEVIVAVDGATDATLERMKDAFGLVEENRIWARAIETQPINHVYRSLRYPNLIVLDKDNGGKADALNAALNLARYPLIASVDADSMLDAEAMLRASRLFVEDDSLIGLGGTVRPVNGAVIKDGKVTELTVPKTILERFQILEYARAFFAGRSGWSHFGSLLIISGAFGLFKRSSVMQVGGYMTDTVCEDMELVVRLHRHHRINRIPYRIRSIPDPICWTEVPSDLATLRRQRNRWHRGLWETLWKHRSMLFNRRYGRLGFVAMPYFWLFEGLAPIIEIAGIAMLPYGLITGHLSLEFAAMFMLLVLVYGMMLSQLSMGIETMLVARYARIRDRLLLLGAALIESLGFRQILVLERFIATFQVIRKKGHWGQMRRGGFSPDVSLDKVS